MAGPAILDEFRHEAHRLYSAVIADVLDAQGYRRQALSLSVRPLALNSRLFGRARTLKMQPVEENPDKPYELEMTAIDSLAAGDVLAIGMSGCPECAVWGELLSTACAARGSAGAVMDGPTRDSEKILALGFPVFAAGRSPLDSKGRIDGVARDVAVEIGGVLVSPGDFIFGDCDGVVVIPAASAKETLAAAIAKVSGENRVREELAAGASVREVFSKYGIL